MYIFKNSYFCIFIKSFIQGEGEERTMSEEVWTGEENDCGAWKEELGMSSRMVRWWLANENVYIITNTNGINLHPRNIFILTIHLPFCQLISDFGATLASPYIG